MTRLVCLFLLLFVACATGAPTERSNVVVKPDVSPPRSEPSPLTVAAITAPDALVVDGKLGEWGDSTAPSRVVVALSPKALYVAARLDPTATAFWLGIQGAPAQAPPVGEYRLVAGSEVDPEMGIVVAECLGASPGDPKCVAAQRKIETDARAYEQRFERWYRIERDRVADVASAKVVFVDGESDRALEISLPLSALPRFAEAPITALGLAVRVGGSSAPELEAKEWSVQTLNVPVAFEPFAELRALAFADSSWMSYQPGNLLEVEATRYPSAKDRSRFVIEKAPLYEKRLVVGDVEVGHLAAGFDTNAVESFGVSDRLLFAIVPKKGAPTALPIKGTPFLLTGRGSEVHALFLRTTDELAHDGSPNASFVPVTSATFSGFVIGSDGQHREISLDDIDNPYWEDVEPFQAEDSVGLRGHTSEWRHGTGKKGDLVELTWRWDPKASAYVGKRTKGKSAKRQGATQHHP